MSYYNVDNECKGLVLWQQYNINQFAIDFFKLTKKFYQDEYFNKLVDELLEELSVETSATDYLIYLAKNWYDIDIPQLYVSNLARWDFDFEWDKNVNWDIYTISLLPLPYFKRLCKTILNFNERQFSIKFFIEQVAYLCQISPEEVKLTTTDNPYQFKLNLPLFKNTSIYNELFINYKSYFNFPLFFDISEITFREV